MSRVEDKFLNIFFCFLRVFLVICINLQINFIKSSGKKYQNHSILNITPKKIS